MRDFLEQVLTKREGKKDGFFAFGFSSEKKILCTRGPKGFNVTKYLIDRQVKSLRRFLA